MVRELSTKVIAKEFPEQKSTKIFCHATGHGDVCRRSDGIPVRHYLLRASALNCFHCRIPSIHAPQVKHFCCSRIYNEEREIFAGA